MHDTHKSTLLLYSTDLSSFSIPHFSNEHNEKKVLKTKKRIRIGYKNYNYMFSCAIKHLLKPVTLIVFDCC